MDTKWAKKPILNINPVNDCHEFVQDKKRAYYAADQRDKKQPTYSLSINRGKLLDVRGHDFPGAQARFPYYIQ